MEGDKPAMNEVQQGIIYREWGKFFNSRNLLDISHNYLSKSLQIQDDDPSALFYRSQCKMMIADVDNALSDAKKAHSLRARQHWIDIHVSQCKYGLNKFEDAIMDLHNYSRNYSGIKTKLFKQRVDVIEENFQDTLGNSLGYFFLEHRKILDRGVKEYLEKTAVDPRPLWKVLREQGKCDVLSILEQKHLLLHPRELARRRLIYKLFNQTYYQRSWQDVVFLKSLRKDKTLLLKQTIQSTKYLQNKANDEFDIANKFLEMLYTRSPLYSERVRRFPSRTRAHKYREDFLFRIQYNTVRHISFILKKIRELRLKKDRQKLCTFVEDIMGNFFILKTHRIMPWKFEFVNEVYNTVALTYIDALRVPSNLDKHPMYLQPYILLNIKSHFEKEETPPFIFGKRSTYQEAGVVDYKYIAYKKFLTRLEKRLLFTDYPIERAYLLHEISDRHLIQLKYDESTTVARKLIDEAKTFNGHAWMFLASIILCKVNASQEKIERLQESIDLAKIYVKNLKSNELLYFVATMEKLNKLILSGKVLETTNKNFSKVSSRDHL